MNHSVATLKLIRQGLFLSREDIAEFFCLNSTRNIKYLESVKGFDKDHNIVKEILRLHNIRYEFTQRLTVIIQNQIGIDPSTRKSSCMTLFNYKSFDELIEYEPWFKPLCHLKIYGSMLLRLMENLDASGIRFVLYDFDKQAFEIWCEDHDMIPNYETRLEWVKEVQNSNYFWIPQLDHSITSAT